MRKLFISLLKIFFFLLITCTSYTGFGQGIGINPSGSSPDNSAALDLSFNNKGFLVPRMTTAERDAIVAPAQALQIFNTTTKCFEFYESGNWLTLSCGCNPPAAAGTITGPSSVCQGESNIS